MSRKDKLLKRFLAKPADFRFAEMSTLLKSIGYERLRTGKTAGSRVAFFNKTSGHLIRLHRPHPGRVLKRYQLDLIEESLRVKGLIP
ncbi:MAG: type II toxin-antitoxin system HicA family toxin [Candidatus Aminicenantes bacterium]|nr:type II toxin-antitoxin system HicA family toxin [Candidatus Aminicenantes bacterium]